MLLNETYLTFGEIADRWARETYDTRDEILLAMIRGVWQGEFEDDSPEPESRLSINRPKTIREDGVYLDEHGCRTDTPPRMAVNRRALLAAMPPIANVPLPPVRVLCPKSGNEPAWKTIKTGIPWDSLLSLTLDEYDAMYRHVYLEGMIISKDDFGRWCDTRGDRRPAFWFGQTAASLNQANRRKGGHRSRHNAGLQEFIDFIHAEFINKGRPFTLSTVTRWLEENAPPADPLETKFEDCTEVYFEGGKISWTDSKGNHPHRTARSLDRYIAKAKSA